MSLKLERRSFLRHDQRPIIRAWVTKRHSAFSHFTGGFIRFLLGIQNENKRKPNNSASLLDAEVKPINPTLPGSSRAQLNFQVLCNTTRTLWIEPRVLDHGGIPRSSSQVQALARLITPIPPIPLFSSLLFNLFPGSQVSSQTRKVSDEGY